MAASQLLCSHLSAAVLLILAAASSAQIAGDWKPVRRPQSLGVSTYHGNAFSGQQDLEDRFSGSSHFGQFDPSLSGHLSSPHDVGPLLGGQNSEDGCALYKVGFNQELYFQYVQFKENIPDLKEFTLCTWTKFHNHSNDHPLFSYAVGNHPKAITSWVSNTDRASYYSLAVAGHTFYRLNYPLRLNRWYHSCQSWNGRTGEWQIWVNGERVGRGFHNRLVGHVIKGGGVAIAGQEQGQVGGGFQEGKEAPKGAGGMLGELTMLQLYRVALTAGKAHKDHKHHHVHHFGHDGSPLPNAATPPPPPPAPPAPPGSILIGGQINPMLQLNLGNSPQLVPSQLTNGLQLNQQYVNGQFGPGRSISEQLFNQAGVIPQNQIQFPPSAGNGIPLQYASQISGNQLGLPSQQIQFPQQYPPSPLGGVGGNRLLLTGQLAHPANVQFIESGYSGHNLFKRNGNAMDVKRQTSTLTENKRNKRDNPEKELMQEEMLAETGDSKKQAKRGLVALSDGSIVDDSLLSSETFEQSLISGLAGFGENVPVQNIQKEKVDEREPAEAEVRAVMDLCNGCGEEPFQKALIISWRHTPKKLFSGALYYPAVPACKAF